MREVAPGEGERRAQRGLVPQSKVAAEKIYALLAAAERRARQGEPPVARVIARLYTSRVASTSALRTPVMRGSGRSLHEFIDSVWRPAQRELVGTIGEVDPGMASIRRAAGAGMQHGA